MKEDEDTKPEQTHRVVVVVDSVIQVFISSLVGSHSQPKAKKINTGFLQKQEDVAFEEKKC